MDKIEELKKEYKEAQNEWVSLYKRRNEYVEEEANAWRYMMEVEHKLHAAEFGTEIAN